jgi:hypothetical protein
MSSLVYVLRHPTRMLSSSLYLPNGSPALTLGVETAVAVATPAQPAEVLHAGKSSRVTTGERLTYRQLLELLIEATKVITL